MLAKLQKNYKENESLSTVRKVDSQRQLNTENDLQNVDFKLHEVASSIMDQRKNSTASLTVGSIDLNPHDNPDLSPVTN